MLRSIFNMENSFWSLMNKLTDLFLVSVVWFFCCLPLVTIGAATTAFFSVAIHLTADAEGAVIHDFFLSFRQKFLQATAVWLIGAAFGGWCVLNLFICLSVGGPLASLLMTLFLAFLFISVIVSIYLFALLSIFSVSTKKAFHDALILAVGHLPHSVCLALLMGAAIFLSAVVPYFCFVATTLLFYLYAYILRWIFRNSIADLPADKENELFWGCQP